MRIVHVNTEMSWRGGESQVFNLMRGLRDRGHEVEAVTQPASALFERCGEDRLPAHGIRMRSDADLPAAFRLSRYLKGRPCDILHAQTSRAHSIALLARKLGAPGRLVVSRRLDFPIRKNFPNLWKYRSATVDRYIAVADVVRGTLVEAGVAARRIAVINSSIDLARFTDVVDGRAEVRASLGVPLDAPLVGNVAALAWHKAQKDLLDAMPALLERVPEARLVVVGGGEEREALERQTAALELTGRVVFTGARRDVPALLTAFDVFCMPSYFEGLCNAVLEAFAMRVPVVAARAGGLPEIVHHEETGLLAPAKDPAQLAAALHRLLTDRDLAARVAGNAHRLVHERFSVQKMVADTEALYRDLLGART